MSGRTEYELLKELAYRSYLVDPLATDADLIEMGHTELATSLRHDHRMGRIAEHHANMTNKRVVVENISPVMMAGALVSPTTKKSRHERVE